jgi:cob(I)alamin adenosyltransferase
MNSPEKSQGSSAHRERMKAVQAEMRAKLSGAKEKRGLLMVHTGNGKGKSTASFGMLLRSLSHGHSCRVMQFIKSSPDKAARLLQGPLIEWEACGDGFTWDTQDREADIARCREGWAKVTAWLKDPEIDFVLLDELNVVLSFDYLPLQEVLSTLQARPAHQHVVLTGRGAPEKLLEAADLVTEMREHKHPFKAGVQAQAGIEF